LTLPVVFAALLGLAGYYDLDAKSQPRADEKAKVAAEPAKAELPQAPAPRPKADGKLKPWSELLVGTWKMVKMDGRQVPAQWDITEEFTSDGKYILRISIPKRPPETETGTYKLSGDTIRLTRPASPDAPEKSWDVTIEALSKDELYTAAEPAKERERSIFKRVEGK
jgi:uncharacterized protein (TIGR03066 family)